MTATGLERGDQVRASCPACAPEAETTHEILKPDADATVRCRVCDHVHKVSIEPTRRQDVRVVISSGGESTRTTAEVPRSEVLAVGEEFVAETPDGPVGVRITSLELQDGERAERATTAEVRTIWTRAVDNVGVPTTIHPSDGNREATVSETVYMPGDEELIVGESLPHADDELTIERLILRDDVLADGPDVLERRDDAAAAKDVKRVFTRRASGDDWRSPWD